MSTELAFGDIITFQTPNASFLEAQGVLDNEIVVANTPQSFEDTLFRICVRTRVAAAEELTAFKLEIEVAQKRLGIGRELTEAEKERMQALERVKDKENEMNMRAMEESWGSIVKHGEVVQFQHVMTGHWVTVKHSSTALVEPENFKVVLRQDAATESWFTLKPGSSFQKMGDPVSDTQEVVIESADNPDEHLHVSRPAIKKHNSIKQMKELELGRRLHELNCSLESTVLKVNRFSQYTPPMAGIRIGDLVMLRDPLTKGHLGVCNGNGTSGLDYCEVTLETAKEGLKKKTAINSSQVWQVQGADSTADQSTLKVGGDLEWGEGFRLRHVNTGKYMSVHSPADLKKKMEMDLAAAEREAQKAAQNAFNIQSAFKAAQAVGHVAAVKAEAEKLPLVAVDAGKAATHEDEMNLSIQTMDLDGGSNSVSAQYAAVTSPFRVIDLDGSDHSMQATLLACDFVPGMNPPDIERVTDKGVCLLSYTERTGRPLFASVDAARGEKIAARALQTPRKPPSTPRRRSAAITSEIPSPAHEKHGAGEGAAGGSSSALASSTGGAGSKSAASGLSSGFALHITPSNEAALPLVICRLDAADEHSAYVLDLPVAKVSVDLLRPFFLWLKGKLDEQKGEASGSVDWHKALASDLREHIGVIKGVFATLLAFVVEDPSKVEPHNINPDPTHQQLMREQGMLDLMMDTLQLCAMLTTGISSPSGSEVVVPVINTLEHELLALLRVCIMKSPTDQEHVANRFNVLLAYVGQNDVANDCVTVLLDNRRIQQEKVDLDTVEAFIQILRDSDENASILDVLAALCSCQGVPMEYSQTELAEILLQRTSTATGATATGATGAAGAANGSGDSGKPLLVEFMMSKKEAKPNRRGSVSECIRLKFPNEESTIALPELTGSKQRFFSSQIYLMAEICYDRNYKAIGIMQQNVSFETLCLAISDTNLDPSIRSGLVKLVTSLYVDCQPQQKHRIKNLSFCWSAIPDGTKQANASYSDPTATSASMGGFGLRPTTPSQPKGRSLAPLSPLQIKQKTLFEKLKVDIKNELVNVTWSAFTEHAVGLLFKLIDFKFYHNTPEDLQEVVRTLLTRLNLQVKADTDASVNAATQRRQSQMALAAVGGSIRKGGSPNGDVNVDESAWAKLMSPESKKRTLKFLDSMPVMFFVIILVFAAVTVGLFLPGIGDEGAKATFDKFTYVIFLLELVFRMWAMGVVEFFTGPVWHYCMIDFVVVALDTLTLIMEAIGGSGPGGGAKVARTIRLMRMLRLFKIRRAMKNIRAAMNKPPDVPPWALGERFKYPQGQMANAMTQMVCVLKQATHIVHRYRLVSLLGSLKQSHLAANRRGGVLQAGDLNKSVRSLIPEIEVDEASLFDPTIFAKVLKEQQQLVVGKPGIDVQHICFNLILYESPALVQEAIELLMAFFGRSEQLLDDLCNVQLLMHPDLESAYASLQAKLDYVSNMLDNYESFCSLSTPEDIATSDAVKLALREIEETCLDLVSADNMRPEDRPVVEAYMMGGSATKPKEDAQTMLRNLYLCEAYQKWRENVPVTLQANHNSETERRNSVGIRARCNSLLCAYMFMNKRNQVQMFRHLDIFVEDLPAVGVGSAAVICEMLRQNEELVKLLPSSLIPNFVDQIVTTGRDASLVDLLSVVQRVGLVPLRANQLAVTQHMTNPLAAHRTMYMENNCSHDMYKDLMLRHSMAERDKGGSTLAVAGNQNSPVLAVSSSDYDHGASIGSIPSPARDMPTAMLASSRQQAISGPGAGIDGLSFVDAGAAPQHCRPGLRNELGHIDPELQYHVGLSRLLALAADGAIHIVESKVQSLFSIDHILEALMSEYMSVPEVKTNLGRLFYDAIVDVQVPVPDLETNSLMWKYLATFPRILARADELFAENTRNGGATFWYPGAIRERGGQTRALMVYVFECVIPIITDFFRCYYDVTKMRHVMDEAEESGDSTDYRLLPNELFHRVIDLYTSNPAVLALEQRQALYACSIELMGLLPPGTGQIDPEDKRYNENMNGTNEGLSEGFEDEEARKKKLARASRKVSVDMFTTAVGTAASKVHWKKRLNKQANLPTPELMNSQHKGRFGPQKKYEKLQDSFTAKVLVMKEDSVVQDTCRQDLLDLIQHIEKIPRKSAKIIQDLRYEVLLAKLVRHTSDQIHVDDDRKNMLPDSTTAVWIIRLFRQMIENKWGFTISERDELGDDDSDDKVAFIQDALDDAGATELCLHLFAKGMDRDVKIEALSLLVALLYREGGNGKVQATMHECLSDSTSEFFFAEVVATLDNVDQFYEDELRFEFDEDKEPETPKSGMLLLRVLQLMCEGHFLKNQNILREQPNNKTSVNLLESFVEHFSHLCKIRNRSAIHVCLGIADVMLEIVQGPCVGNQECFALESELLECLNRSMRLMSEPLSEQAREDGSCDILEDEQFDLIECMLRIIKALLEGQVKDHHGKNMIYERILSVVHLEMLSMMLNPPEIEMTADVDDLEAAIDAREKAENAPLNPMQVEALVVIQTLMVYNSTLQDDMNFSESVVKKMGSEVVSVEVMWNGELQKKQFKAPDLCKHLVKPTRDALVANVDRDNFDSQMNDFIDHCNAIHCELQHQEFMESIGLSSLFSRGNQDSATWLTFYINLLINVLYLCFMEMPGKVGVHPDMDMPEVYLNGEVSADYQYNYYPKTATGKGEYFMDPSHALSDVPVWVRSVDQRQKCVDSGFDFENFCWSWDTKLVVLICNYTQITLSFFTLVLFVCVRAPVTYKATFQETSSMASSLVAIFTKTHTLYYVGYVILAVLGMDYPLFNSILLLDIIMKSATCYNVIKSVTHPFRQLMITCMLMLFLMFIFTFIFFDTYHDHFKYGECNTMLRCSLVMLNFGMRNGGGLADYTYDDSVGPVNELGGRYAVDFAYFVIVLIILLNIVFGIIIDTFSELRDEKNEKEEKTEEFCFICGIAKNKFEQLGPGSFDDHIRPGGDHDMWSYLRFIIYIADQDEDDDDGLESYIRECIDTNNLDWIPNGKAIALVDYADEDETPEEKANKLVETMRTDILSALHAIKSEAEEKHRTAMMSLTEVSEKLQAASEGKPKVKGWSRLTGAIKRGRYSQRQKKGGASVPPITRKPEPGEQLATPGGPPVPGSVDSTKGGLNA